MKKSYGTAVIKKRPQSQIEIIGSVPADIFDAQRTKALANINKTVKIDGFRDGNVPEKMLVAKVGEKTILEEMAELALSEAYPAIIIDNNLDPISRPEIRITKMAMGNPLEFIITTAVTPEVKLGDYKKIASATPPRKADESEVSEKEVAEALERIRKSHAEDGTDHTGHDHSSFETPEFKKRIHEALVSDKERVAREKRRIEMAEKISDASTIELPTVLIDSELRRSETQFAEDITRMGTTVKDYLNHAKKTIDDLRKEWKPQAEKKVKLQLILNKIAELEKIVVEAQEIEAEVKHILEHYKDADRERASIYAAGVLSNEKVFQFLEKQSDK
jgi:FKBP-type peptidyl-prolyl cis-trans isomerase (trigger factor)